MPDITYSLGGINFDAVPRDGARTVEIASKAEVTLGRKRLFTLAIPGEKLHLKGDYLTETTRASLENLIWLTEQSGTEHIFDNGVNQYHALIERFACVAIVGIAEAAYSFELDLLLLGEVQG